MTSPASESPRATLRLVNEIECIEGEVDGIRIVALNEIV